VVRPGPDPAADIVSGTRRGILVLAVDSADALPAQGRFILRIAEAREITDGIPGRWLAGFSVHGGLDDLAELDAVGDDQQTTVSICGKHGRWLPVSHAAPTIRLPRLSVRGLRAG
jgi:predicted Zn-dependent protease